MLTTRGWALATGNLMLLIAGRLFGIRELFELGLGLATLVITACILVRRGRHETRLSRVVEPVEVYPGSLVRVEVTVKAGARRSPPLLYVEDLPVDLTESPGPAPRDPRDPGARGPDVGLPGSLRRARKEPPPWPSLTAQVDQARRAGRRTIAFPVGSLEAHATHRVAYRVIPSKRGRYEIGPGSTIITDPFGLARAPDRPLAKSFLLVFPAVEMLLPISSMSTRSLETALRPLNPTLGGDEFFTLRQYASGDDVKKIHWRSTARQGRLMVRQEDRPSEPRVMVLLDDTRRSHARRADGADSFEACIASAASLITLFTAEGLAVGLSLASRALALESAAGLAGGRGDLRAGPAGPRSPERFGTGPAHQRGLMQRLAMLGTSSGGNLPDAMAALTDPRLGATYLAVVTTELDPGWFLGDAGRAHQDVPLLVVRHLRYSYLNLTADRVHQEQSKASATAVAVERAGGVVVDVRAGKPLRPAWEQRLGTRVRPAPVGAP